MGEEEAGREEKRREEKRREEKRRGGRYGKEWIDGWRGEEEMKEKYITIKTGYYDRKYYRNELQSIAKRL